MAVSLGNSPVVMTAAADSIGNDGKHWKVTEIRILTGATSGQTILLDKEGGKVLGKTPTGSQNAESNIPVYAWLDGVYVDTLPSGAEVHVYYM